MKKLYLMLWAFGSLFAQNALSQCDTTTSLLVDVRLDSSFVDSSTYNQPTYVQGSLTFAFDRHGNPNGALNTSGGSLYLNDPNGNFQCQFPITVSMWIYPINLGTNNLIFMNEDHATAYSGVYINISQNGQLNAHIGDGGNAGPGSRKTFSTAAQTIADGQWYHIAAVYRSLSDVRVYVDGTELSTTTSGSGSSLHYFGISGTPGKIGGGVNGIGTNHTFNGLVDDVRFWNDSLVDLQVQAIHEGGLDIIGAQSIQLCTGNNITISVPTVFCDYNWSNGSTTASTTIIADDLGVGSHTIYATMYDENNIEYVDSVIVDVSVCVGIENPIDEAQISVYPNPTKGELNIKTSTLGHFRITNVLGEVVSDFTLNQNETIDIAHFAGGVYFLTELNSGKTFKLVKE